MTLRFSNGDRTACSKGDRIACSKGGRIACSKGGRLIDGGGGGGCERVLRRGARSLGTGAEKSRSLMRGKDLGLSGFGDVFRCTTSGRCGDTCAELADASLVDLTIDSEAKYGANTGVCIGMLSRLV